MIRVLPAAPLDGELAYLSSCVTDFLNLEKRAEYQRWLNPGFVHWAISREDLAACDLDKAKYVWNDWDD